MPCLAQPAVCGPPVLCLLEDGMRPSSGVPVLGGRNGATSTSFLFVFVTCCETFPPKCGYCPGPHPGGGLRSQIKTLSNTSWLSLFPLLPFPSLLPLAFLPQIQMCLLAKNRWRCWAARSARCPNKAWAPPSGSQCRCCRRSHRARGPCLCLRPVRCAAPPPGLPVTPSPTGTTAPAAATQVLLNSHAHELQGEGADRQRRTHVRTDVGMAERRPFTENRVHCPPREQRDLCRLCPSQPALCPPSRVHQ